MSCRWLIDIGKDNEGMIVIADLHGGDLDNDKAREEFREIRDVVAQEASLTKRLVAPFNVMYF